MKRFCFGLYISVLLLCSLSAQAQAPQLSFDRSGTLSLENSLLKIQAANRPGDQAGIRSMMFKPTGYEMVDVLYGQTDYVTGHLLGERFDQVEFKGINGFKGQNPGVGSLYVPVEAGVSADGSGAKVVQCSSGTYGLTRTLVVRRDYSVVEVRYEIKNNTGDPAAFSLRFHSALSPGARGKYQNKNEDIWMRTENGLIALDQSQNVDQYFKKYGTDKYFLPTWKEEPARQWTRNVNATLADNWAVSLNRDNGDGAGYVIDRDQLVGYYNAPGATLEPVMKAAALEKGQSWKARVFVVAFTGAKGKQLGAVTPLYAATKVPEVEGGAFNAEVVPLFQGTLQIEDGDGKVVTQQKASPSQAITLTAKTGDKGWKLVARDTTNALIGSIDDKGKLELSEPRINVPSSNRPVVNAVVYNPNAKETTDFLKQNDITVFVDWNAPDAQKKAANEIAQHLGAGLTYTMPASVTKVLAIGSPQENAVVREAGLLHNSFSASWPGTGKGAIIAYDNYEGTANPLLVVGGSDADGTMKAIEEFKQTYLTPIKPASSFDFYVTSTSTKVFPYTRPGVAKTGDKVTLEMARGEYEPAQLVVTPYERLTAVEVTMAPLVNAATGEEINPKKQYLTNFQKRNGPLWLRYVNYFPIAPEGGWTGNPDPLLEKQPYNLEAGQSQGMWLTTIMPETAAPGLWRSSITVKANGQEKTIPVEVNVWNFNVPRMGILGDPYIRIENFRTDGTSLTTKNVTALVENLVEHGMRTVHLGPQDMFRWHFSKTGAYKGKETDWLEVSDDGQVALDTSYFDQLIDTCDDAAKPYALRFMVYLNALMTNEERGEFEKTLPQRHAGKPQRSASPASGYYAEDMMRLFKQHLDRRGLTKRLVLKIADEPRGFQFWYDTATQAARAVGMPMMTAFNNMDYSEAEQAIDKVAQWEVLYQIHNPEFFKKAQQAGTLVSWYNCGPPPRISAAASGSEIRSYLWQAAKADLDMISWWGIQCWNGSNDDIWTNRYSSWDSVMYPVSPKSPAWMKPGKGWTDTAPIDSIRWELIREGMEDAKYVYLLRDLIAQARQKGMAAEADKAEATLNDIWKNVFPTLNDYRPDYNLIADSRHKVATAILDLQTQLGTPAQIRQARNYER